MSKLNKDILFLLFEELQGDSKSLFSCLLVNRLWCETAIPILWRNPWRYNDIVYYQNQGSLYHVIISSLPNDVKEFLANHGTQLFPTSTSYQSLLFDYLSFCKSINMRFIRNIISFRFTSTYEQFILQQEIYRLFMNKFTELRYLDMGSIEHQIFSFPKAKTCLDSLCVLRCDTSIDSIYFYGLACICKHIQRFIITNTNVKDDNDGIFKLIEAQKNLKYFKWKDDLDYDPNDYFDFEGLYILYEGTFLALEKQASTLNHLTISFEYLESSYLDSI